MILPKGKKETPDLFLRRLDAHKINPMAMLVMRMPPESELDTVHRYIATKENEAEGLLVLPRTEHEGETEFKDRMELATSCPVIVLGKGENESADDFKLRLSSQAKARAPVMPRSYGEPDKSFKARMELSLQMDGSVPTFHAKVESEREYAVRLRLQKERPDQLLGHGDPLAKDAAKDEAAAAAAAAAKPKAAPPAPAPEPEPEPEWTEPEPEPEPKPEPEPEPHAAPKLLPPEPEPVEEVTYELERVDLNATGFMVLKKMLVERGVPEAEVKVPNKFMLKEVAARHQDTVKLEFF